MTLSIGLAAGYILLFVLVLGRRGQNSAAKWLAGALFASAITSLFYGLRSFPTLFPNVDWQPGLALAGLYILSVSLLGAVTIEFLSQPFSWAWPAAGTMAVAAVAIGTQFEPAPGMLDQTWLASMMNTPPSVVGWAAAGVWLLAALGQLGFSVFRMQLARLPLHANRILFWSLWLPVVILGAAAAAWAEGPLAAIGQGVQFAGMCGLAYAVLSMRLIDVRNLARRAVGQAMLVVITAIITMLAIEAANVLLAGLGGIERLIGVAALALGAAVLYQALRGLTEQVITQLVLRSGYDITAITREFSDRVVRLLDVPELAHAAGETFRSVFAVRRSALLLLTTGKDGTATLQPIPGTGKTSNPPLQLPADSPVLRTLTVKHQPLLQFDIDTDPLFGGVGERERAWFQGLQVDVYLPVRDGATLSGIFAVGSKTSGDPFRAEELDILASLADQTSVALKNSRLFTDLRALNDEMATLNRNLQDSNETLEQMDRVKTDFITIASHELRTPLTQLRGYADLLGSMIAQNMLNPETATNIVESIKRASDRLNAVYGQMLDASQMDVNALDLKLVDTTLDAVLRLAVEPFAGPMRDRKQTLTAQGVRGLPAIRGDFQRLVQAFGQVIGNAVKYTPDGGRIDIAARLLTPDADQPPSVEVVVADTGIGIDPKFHELIFQKFFRIGSTSVHSTGTTKFMGAGPGLGLPIAKGIVERHGGRIWVESPGQDLKAYPGTRVHVVLPISPPAFTPSQTAAFMGEAK